MNVFITNPVETKEGKRMSISLNDEELKKYKICSFEKTETAIHILLEEKK